MDLIVLFCLIVREQQPKKIVIPLWDCGYYS